MSSFVHLLGRDSTSIGLHLSSFGVPTYVKTDSNATIAFRLSFLARAIPVKLVANWDKRYYRGIRCNKRYRDSNSLLIFAAQQCNTEDFLLKIDWIGIPFSAKETTEQTISFQNSMDKEIDRRIASAWKKFWGLSFILMDKGQKLRNKRQIFNSCIAHVLIYGVQSWPLTKKQALKLGRCQRRMERKILGISLKDRIKNEEVRRRSGIEDVVTLANRIKWR
ncbi:hypothetical protein ANN_17558 [Periplaneta americana]|uniref:Uncharacterized protein n=1 Tax=Periplaneta americana TaxID=6978 RepID=A0ABQ8STB5_PERAM|nr:hypothetical protein ANN_17558 [Periplaneta americana]